MSTRRSFLLTNGLRRDQRGVPILNNYHRIGVGRRPVLRHLAPLLLIPLFVFLWPAALSGWRYFQYAGYIGVIGLPCLIMLALIYVDLRARRGLEALPTAAELAEAAGITEEELQRRAAERGIKPVYRVNSADLYDPADLEGAGLLLRPAEPPTDGALLRPAGAQPASAELLLRAADDA